MEGPHSPARFSFPLPMPFLNCSTFVVQSLSHVRIFVTPWAAACQASLSFTIFQSLCKLTSIESVMPSNHLILCRPCLLLPSVFRSIRVFSNESALRIRWPSTGASASVLPVSLKIVLFDLLSVQGTRKSLIQSHSLKTSVLWHSAFFMVQLSHSYMTTGKTITDYTDLCQQSDVSAF